MTKKVEIRQIISIILAIFIGVLWSLPIVGVIMVAIRPISEVLNGWWDFSSFHPTIENFFSVWTHSTLPLGRAIVNSIIIASFATIIPIFIAALAAYGFARFSFPIKTYLFIFLVMMMAMPQQMVAIPLFQILVDLHLIDTYPGLILVHSAWGLPWIILFLRNFFKTLPVEIEEAARVDGASDFQIFLQIVLPMSLPAILSVVALQFTWVWNDFFFALLIIYTPDNYVATQALAWLKGKYHTPWDLMSAGALIVMVTPVLVYAILQKYYTRGMIGWVGKG
ncbi:MAG: carbohydrate ABC transporter permease [Candidatus Odinarchaeota archaeon]|nr:carbohydrate ABC transporter permease [Candidatus Odinarchaeota archaeon]